MLDLFYRYNIVFFESLQRCEVIFTHATNETLFETRNQFNQCAEIHKNFKIPLKTEIKIQKPKNDSKNLSQMIRETPLNLYNNQKKILQAARINSHQVIQEIAVNATSNYTNIISNVYKKDNKKDIGCCFENPKEQIDAAMVIAKNESDKCFENKTSQFESFVALI